MDNIYILRMRGTQIHWVLYMQLGIRGMSLGGLNWELHLFRCSCPPWASKHAVEDKPGQNSDKTVHCITPATYARRFLKGMYDLLCMHVSCG